MDWIKTLTVFLIVVYGVGAAVVVVSVVVYDLIALRNDWRTVSDDTFRLGHTYVAFLVAAVGTLCLAMGMLLGHLFLGQAIHSPGHKMCAPDCCEESKP